MPLNPLILKHVFHRLLAPWNTLPEEIPWPTKCGNPSKLQPRFRIKGSERKHFDPTLPKLTWRGTILLPCARVCVCVCTRVHTQVHTWHPIFRRTLWGMFLWPHGLRRKQAAWPSCLLRAPSAPGHALLLPSWRATSETGHLSGHRTFLLWQKRSGPSEP